MSLSYFASIADNNIRLNWSKLEHETECRELFDAGLITGKDTRSSGDGGLVDGVLLLGSPAITLEGVSKLVELSDYYWKTSWQGKMLENVTKFGWSIAGAAIGVTATLLAQWFSAN